MAMSPDGGLGKNNLNVRDIVRVVSILMKTLFTIAVTVVAMAAFATSTFAGDCGSCPAGGKKAKDKTEEGSQS